VTCVTCQVVTCRPESQLACVKTCGNPSVTTPGCKSSCNSPTIEIKVPPIKTLARLKKKESHLGLSPGKPDIASWISSSVDSQMLDDTIDDNGANFVWRRDLATSEWAEALGYASRQLLSSRSNVRIPFLREDLLPLVKHEGTCFPRYHSVMHRFMLCRSQSFPSTGCVRASNPDVSQIR
jgi:hypothetical protein